LWTQKSHTCEHNNHGRRTITHGWVRINHGRVKNNRGHLDNNLSSVRDNHGLEHITRGRHCNSHGHADHARLSQPSSHGPVRTNHGYLRTAAAVRTKFTIMFTTIMSGFQSITAMQTRITAVLLTQNITAVNTLVTVGNATIKGEQNKKSQPCSQQTQSCKRTITAKQNKNHGHAQNSAKQHPCKITIAAVYTTNHARADDNHGSA
jgi:hypothetical protein